MYAKRERERKKRKRIAETLKKIKTELRTKVGNSGNINRQQFMHKLKHQQQSGSRANSVPQMNAMPRRNKKSAHTEFNKIQRKMS